MLISEQQLASAQRESLGASEDPVVSGAVSSLLRNLGVRSVVFAEPFSDTDASPSSDMALMDPWGPMGLKASASQAGIMECRRKDLNPTECWSVEWNL